MSLTTMPSRDALSRILTFARSALTGGTATLADMAALFTLTTALHLSPRAANLPALLCGAVVQFFGNRHFAFRAASGSLRRQALLFTLTELVALTLNALLYDAVARSLVMSPAVALLARAITTNMVFLFFSYPLWCRVFRARVDKSV